jgi:hypothetical protein
LGFPEWQFRHPGSVTGATPKCPDGARGVLPPGLHFDCAGVPFRQAAPASFP